MILLDWRPGVLSVCRRSDGLVSYRSLFDSYKFLLNVGSEGIGRFAQRSLGQIVCVAVRWAATEPGRRLPKLRWDQERDK